MSWVNQLFGSGLLDPEMEKRLSEQQKKQLANNAMMNAGLAMLANSGYSRTPITLGESLAQGLGAGRQAYSDQAQGLQAQYKAQVEREQAEQQRMLYESMLQGVPPEQVQMFRLMGPKAGLNEMAQRTRPQPQKAESRTTLQKEAEQLFPGNATDQAKWIKEQRAKPTGTTVNVGNGAGGQLQEGLLSVEQAVALGLPYANEGIRYQVKNGKLEPIKVDRPEQNTGGMNERQRAGMAVRNSAALDYAANLTGVPKEQLAQMSPAEVEAAILIKGKRALQGVPASLLSSVPLIGKPIVNAFNSDIAPYSSQMAAGQVSINNPAGDTGERAFDLAEKQVPGANIPLEQQAQMIRKALEEEERLRNGRTTQPAKSASQMSDADILKGLGL